MAETRIAPRFGTRVEMTERRAASWYSSRDELIWVVWFALLVLGSLWAAFALAGAGVTGPDPVLFAWIAYIAGAVLILARPRWGVYLITFLTLLGDARLMPGYPFTKNFSSAESIFYLGDAYIFSALELYLVLTLGSWLFRERMARRLHIFSGELLAPVLLFGLLVVWGLVYGLGIRGGNVVIGLWEARPILYLPLFMLLASNLLRTPRHIRLLFWFAVAGMLVESFVALFYIADTLRFDIGQVDRLTDHSASIQLNIIILLAAAVWVYRRGPRFERWALPLASLVIILPYLAAQRRAAFIALAIGFFVLAFAVYQERRRLFWMATPVVAAGAMLYVAAFWNSSSALALPAQAIKSVVARTGASGADWSSNFYRILENANIAFTIHTSPLTGVGFGNTFHVRVVMPDISFFEWWQYITHNSILWIWMKMGVAGFIALIAMVSLSLMTGVRALARLGEAGDRLPGYLQPLTLVAILYLVMHFIFAYVDISWDTQSMVLVGAMMGIINRVEALGRGSEDGP